MQARLAYQEQDTRLTLREGLAEYLASNPDLIDTNDTSTGEMAAYFANHDASHVAFGTSTRIEDELIQDIWTLVAIDVKYRNYVGDLVKAKEGMEVAKALPFWGTIKGFFHLLTVVPRLLTRSRKMPKKWPWTGWEKYLDKPLSETRQEFGIRVL
ncbi:MAG: hypothetical protein NZ990_02985 [Myxococcota bacterium]|nr:hypothetical protein [Myxococcota bacterium]